jgi:hypothetical protein
LRVIQYIPKDPTDYVLAGKTIGDFPMGEEVVPWPLEPVLQGESINDLFGDPVPRAMIGWNPYTPWPTEIGPMAISGGLVGMVPIGPVKPVSPIIDPVQRFLNSMLALDATGAYTPADVLLGYQEVPWSWLVAGENGFGPSLSAVPRREIVDSGIVNKLTAGTLAPEFGQKIYDFTQSGQSFTLVGLTKTGAGVALGGCRVIALQAGWRYVDNAPVVIAETTSDGSGNFTLNLRNIDYQLTAYKEGSPDVAGITRQDVVPTVVTTVHLRNPTTVDSGGGGGTRVYPLVS